MARLDGVVAPPKPTHSKYYSTDPTRLDSNVKKWVGMAEALGWGMTGRPYPTVAGKADKEHVGGSAARKILYDEREADNWVYVSGNQKNATQRPAPAPAPTILFGHDAAGVRWERKIVPGNDDWFYDRPSTSIVASEIIAGPGSAGEWVNGGVSRQNRAGSIRVTLEETAILQSFSRDFVWCGSKGKQFQQVGNAVPPLLAEAILSSLLSEPVERSEWDHVFAEVAG